VEGGEAPLVSVKTKEGIPKEKIADAMKEIKKIKVQAPVQIGDVVLADVANTGIAMVVTKNVAAL
jgi:CxxC motif-containing protein